jgi:ESCRT-II complex subunit VPS22
MLTLVFVSYLTLPDQGFWGRLLGVGDFYYTLGVEIVDVCMATRAQNGGLITSEIGCKRLTRTLSRMHAHTYSHAILTPLTQSHAHIYSHVVLISHLISVEELVRRCTALRGKNVQAISDDDVRRAIKKIAVLGR